MEVMRCQKKDSSRETLQVTESLECPPIERCADDFPPMVKGIRDGFARMNLRRQLPLHPSRHTRLSFE